MSYNEKLYYAAFKTGDIIDYKYLDGFLQTFVRLRASDEIFKNIKWNQKGVWGQLS